MPQRVTAKQGNELINMPKNSYKRDLLEKLLNKLRLFGRLMAGFQIENKGKRGNAKPQYYFHSP